MVWWYMVRKYVGLATGGTEWGVGGGALGAYGAYHTRGL